MDTGIDHEELLNSSSAVWIRLPSAPVFMCIMKTLEGKPIGMPIWKTFENRPDERTLENETVSSTLLNLSHILSMLTKGNRPDTEGVMRISYANRTWSIYLPSPTQEFQITFIVAFEETDQVLITTKDREVLTKELVQAIQTIKEFNERIKNEEEWIIDIQDPLYKEILHKISDTIFQWDKKRIKYLKKEAEKLRKRLREEEKERRKQEEEAE